MSFFGLQSKPRAGNTAGRVTLIVPLVLVLGFLVLGVLLWRKMGLVENQVREVAGQMEKASQVVEQAAEESRQARLRASQAEENSMRAARTRDEAQVRKEVAEREAESARVELESSREETRRLREQQEAELDRLHRALNRVAETRRTAIGVVMSLGSDSLRFEFDKATLKPENREVLSRIAGILLTSSDFRVDVYGHTDDIGTEEYNQFLSERRAQAVRDYLIQAGVGPELISTKGFGKSSPRTDGADSGAREKNRRVEIAVVNTRILELDAQNRELPPPDEAH
jgi:outer membrane protein OmpA-like peptidoglycan-associated protein